jgi:hypothetical protein
VKNKVDVWNKDIETLSKDEAETMGRFSLAACIHG